MPSLAENLQSIRSTKGLTRYAFAQAAGISQYYVRELECGNKRNPSVDVLSRMAKALECTVDDLIPRSEESA